MIEVRIRKATEIESVHLAEVWMDQLDSVIPTIRGWGLDASGDIVDDLSGQFVYNPDANPPAYFEVIIGDEDE